LIDTAGFAKAEGMLYVCGQGFPREGPSGMHTDRAEVLIPHRSGSEGKTEAQNGAAWSNKPHFYRQPAGARIIDKRQASF